MDSLTFKKHALNKVEEMKAKNSKLQVQMLVENELENLNAWKDKYPFAISIFVKGAMLKPEPLKWKSIQIRNFCE